MRPITIGAALLSIAPALIAASQTTVPQIRVADGGVVEGDSRTRTVNVHVMLSQPASGPISVAYATRNGSATAGADYAAATGSLTFAKGDTIKSVAVAVIGDTSVEPNETLDVVVSAPAGATIADDTGNVTIVNDDFPPGSTGLPTYEVRFTSSGHTGSMVGNPKCPVRNNGTSTLEGLVSGSERVAADDDIEYKGTLWFSVDMDLCEVDRDTKGEDFFCSISAIGDAILRVNLSVYAANRGGYVQTEAIPGAALGTMFGGQKPCTSQLISDEFTLFPNDTRANTFNSAEMKLPSGPLRVGKYPAAANWMFEVLRKVR